jgi:hypothetical protein
MNAGVVKARSHWQLVVAISWVGSLSALLFLVKRLSPAEASAFLMVAVGLVFAINALIRRISPLGSPFYLALYSYVFFVGVGPLISEIIDPYSLASGVLRTIGLWPLTVSWLGLGGLCLGHWLCAGRVVLARPRESRANPDPPNLRRYLWFATCGYTLVGAAGVALYIHLEAGLDHLLSTVYGTEYKLSVFVGPYLFLRAGLFLLLAWVVSAKKRSTVFLWGVVCLYVVVDVLWFGPVNGSRRQAITLLLSLFYISKYCRLSGIRTRGSSLAINLVVISGIALALTWGGLRSLSIDDIMHENTGSLDLAKRTPLATESALYAPFDSFVRIVEQVPQFLPYQYGKTLWEAATVFVPRPLWKNKPASSAEWLSYVLYGSESAGNSVATWPGELYLNFGTVGVILGMLFMGVLCAFLSGPILGEARCSISLSQGLMAGVWFPLFFEWIWGGSNPAVWYILTNVLPVWTVLWWARREFAMRKTPDYRRKRKASLESVVAPSFRSE